MWVLSPITDQVIWGTFLIILLFNFPYLKNDKIEFTDSCVELIYVPSTSDTHHMLNKGKSLLFIKVRLELGCRLLTADPIYLSILLLINWLHSHSLFQVNPEWHKKDIMLCCSKGMTHQGQLIIINFKLSNSLVGRRKVLTDLSTDGILKIKM